MWGTNWGILRKGRLIPHPIDYIWRRRDPYTYYLKNSCKQFYNSLEANKI